MLDLEKKSQSDYTVITTLGMGAFGTTYLATKKGDTSQKQYVLKVLSITSRNVADLFQEVDVLKKISATGCPKTLLCFHEYFVTEMQGTNKLVIVTEAFENAITLGKFIYARKKNPLEATDILKIMHSLLEGLYHLHKKGIAHGDIKPDNILINDKLQTQIIDFGLSCRKHCKSGGTMLFSAPEMIRLLGGRREIQRSFLSETDVFSMGLVFYLLANFKFPYTIHSNPYVSDDISNSQSSSVSGVLTEDSDMELDSDLIGSSRVPDVPNQNYDVRFNNDILGIDRFWRNAGNSVKSYYNHSDSVTNADINGLIESMLIVSTQTKQSRPSSKRLLSKIRKIIFGYNFRANGLASRRHPLVVLSPNSELEALTPTPI